MLKSNIYCKSALNKEQLEARKSLKKSGIELQLLGDFEDTPLSTDEYIEILGQTGGKPRLFIAEMKA